MLMFPSELPAVLQAKESAAPAKEEKITEDDFLSLLTDLDREFVKKADDPPVKPKKKRVLEALELPPKKTMLLTAKPTETPPKKKKKWLEAPEILRKPLIPKMKEVTPEQPKEVTPEPPKEVTPEPAKKATQTEKEEGGSY